MWLQEVAGSSQLVPHTLKPLTAKDGARQQKFGSGATLANSAGYRHVSCLVTMLYKAKCYHTVQGHAPGDALKLLTSKLVDMHDH